MQFCNEGLDLFIGGQVQITKPGEFTRRGEIAAISVDLDELAIRLEWMGRSRVIAPRPRRWVFCSDVELDLSLGLFKSANIADGRIVLSSIVDGETITLYPMGQTRLDRTQVEGPPARVLELSSH